MAGIWFYFVIFSGDIVYCKPALKKIYRKPIWTYQCLDSNECQQLNNPFPISNSSISTSYGSLAMCWSVCGQYGGLWPRPEYAKLDTVVVKIDPYSYILQLVAAPKATHPILKKMTEMAFSNIRAECDGFAISLGPKRVMVHIAVKASNMTLIWETSERYTLNVTTIDQHIFVNIVGDTVYGARHGLESFTQLASSVSSTISGQPRCGIYVVSNANITDQPVFKHRGLLLDTAKQFIPVESIIRTLDGMAASKMNIFHWHVTDSQSFPLQSLRVPELSRFGAYSSKEIYWIRDVKKIIEYAQWCGIRVVIEIDGPAHVGEAWHWGQEQGVGKMVLCLQNGKYGQLNIANPTIYYILKNLYRDIVDYLPSPALFHMGGDGVSIRCWNSSQDITKFMEKKSLHRDRDGFFKLWAEYYDKELRTWDEESFSAGKARYQPVMLWSSDLTHPIRIQNLLDKQRFVIELWDSTDIHLINEWLRLGYRIVEAPRNYWYLNNGVAGIGKYSTWKRMYSHKLPTHPLMLGGEVCMWTEFVNEYSLDNRLWPRAAAVAERLWSDPETYNQEVAQRMQRHRERLVSRRLHPEPLASNWCRAHDCEGKL